jgi:hypothetical protein
MISERGRRLYAGLCLIVLMNTAPAISWARCSSGLKQMGKFLEAKHNVLPAIEKSDQQMLSFFKKHYMTVATEKLIFTQSRDLIIILSANAAAKIGLCAASSTLAKDIGVELPPLLIKWSGRGLSFISTTAAYKYISVKLKSGSGIDPSMLEKNALENLASLQLEIEGGNADILANANFRHLRRHYLTVIENFENDRRSIDSTFETAREKIPNSIQIWNRGENQVTFFQLGMTQSKVDIALDNLEMNYLETSLNELNEVCR